MLGLIGIRRENKDLSERRSPLTPAQVKALIQRHGVQVKIEPATNRIYRDSEYQNVGAIVTTDLADCNIIFGVKEIPTSYIQPKQTYCFFPIQLKVNLITCPC